MQDYQLTKTIRFKLSPIEDALVAEVNVIKANQSQATEEIAEFNQWAKELAKGVKDYLFTQANNEQPLKLNSRLEVKKNWLKQHTKEHYYVWNTTENSKLRSHKISEVSYLQDELLGWQDRWNSLVEQLETLQKRPEENPPRRAEFALLIATFTQKHHYRFMRDFINESQNKTSDTIKNNLLKLLPLLEKSLTQCQQQYLPDQSKGLIIARSSLNYYTINKKPRDYNEEKDKAQDKLASAYPIGEFKQMMNEHWGNQKNILIGQAEHQDDSMDTNNKISVLQQYVDDLENINLDNAYRLIKQYKAEAKSEFNEASYSESGVNLERDKDKYPLFLKDMERKKKEFDKFVQNTKKITTKNQELNALDNNLGNNKTAISILKTEIKETKQNRGSYFNSAVKFSALIEKFKKVAMQRGKIIASIKGIEKEKIDSQLLNYWALIMQKNNQHQLLLIPKDQAAKAYRKLNNIQDVAQSPTSIHYFKSLTLRALKKLCFGTQGNTFITEIKQELISKYPRIQGAFSLANLQSEAEIVEFYQYVLNTEYVKTNLDIQDFDGLDTLINNTEIKGLEDFEKELEKVCYKKRILAGKALIGYLRHECKAQCMKITSYDLTKDTRRKSKDKQHTQIWQQFWSQDNANNHYPIRLNPELKISWRKPKESRINKYGKDSDKNNRYLHPQFTLVTTITENANGKRLDLAFTDQDTLAEKIQEFNQSFNQEHAKDPHAMYFYGIDRGQAELATLALVSRFTTENNEHKQPIPEFANFSVYRLKDDCLDYSEQYKCKAETKSRLAIKNLSYFIDKEALFNKDPTSSIDLTTAKLIKGKIVENGDVLSYLRLKELNAKRRLYEYFSQANIDYAQLPVIYFKDNKFCVHTLNNNPQAIVYYYRDDLEKICTKESIKKMLNDYLHQLKNQNCERDILTVEKINHLRDAMAANMVGIIAHIYQQCPGIIALEDLGGSQIEKHFMQSNENISRRLEWRLYNKFQNLGLVPPRLKETILLREDTGKGKGKTEGVKQFGLIHFIKTDGTSKDCPYCGETNTKKGKEWENDKHVKRVFDCNNPKCGFNTKTNRKGMKSLNDPDTVASYNIAKRGFNYVLDPLQLENQKQKHATNNPSKNTHPIIKTTTNRENNKQMTNSPFKDLKEMIKKQDE